MLKDNRIDIRHKTVEILLNILKSNKFSLEYWDFIYQNTIVGTIKSIQQITESSPNFKGFAKFTITEVIKVFALKIDILGKHISNFAELISGFISSKDEVNLYEVFFKNI